MKKMRLTAYLFIALLCLGVTGCTAAQEKDTADNQSEQEVTVPVTEPVEAKLKTVTLGNIHSAAITANGSLYLWGDNFWGQLGTDNRSSCNVPTKIMEHVIFVSVGEQHSAAITAEGDLYTWGTGKQRLGNGDKESSESVVLTPTKISVPKSS